MTDERERAEPQRIARLMDLANALADTAYDDGIRQSGFTAARQDRAEALRAALAATPTPAQAQAEKFREHSITLNRLAWKAAEKLGKTNGLDEIYCDPEALILEAMEATTTPAQAPAQPLPQHWMDVKALEVAQRFTQDTEGQRRASLQCAVVEAMQFAAAPPQAAAQAPAAPDEGTA